MTCARRGAAEITLRASFSRHERAVLLDGGLLAYVRAARCSASGQTNTIILRTARCLMPAVRS